MSDDHAEGSLRARPLYYAGVLFNSFWVWAALVLLWAAASDPSDVVAAVVAAVSFVVGVIMVVRRVRRCGVTLLPERAIRVQRFLSCRIVAIDEVRQVTHRTVRFTGGSAQIPVIRKSDGRIVTVPSSCGVDRDVARLRRLLAVAPPPMPVADGMRPGPCECHVVREAH